MKNMKNIIGLLFLTAIVCIEPLQADIEDKTIEVIDEQVDKKMSLLDKILYYVEIIRDEPHNTLAQGKSRAIISMLMEDEDLDIDIKQAIEDDIDIILNSKIKSELDAAYQRLVDTYNGINAKAHVVDATVEATEMVQNASPEDLEETIAQAKQKIEQAEQEQQSFMGRMYTKAKRFVTAPVNYVFGEEASYAKTAFYAAVGLAILAAGGYSVYQYLGQDLLATQMAQKINEEYPNVSESLKRQYIQKAKESKELWDSSELGYEAKLAKSNELQKQYKVIEEQLETGMSNKDMCRLKKQLCALASKELFTEKYGKLSNEEVLRGLKKLVEENQENPKNRKVENKMFTFRDELFTRGVFTQNSDFWDTKREVSLNRKRKEAGIKKADSN